MMVQAHKFTAFKGLRLGLALFVIFSPPALSISWRSEVKVRPPLQSPSDALQHQLRLPDVYAVALNELKELEAQPLCHRVAARLLVNNCQLLDGKDEATILTDSGRQLRDFVDSYAASLAICDLERGAFKIPYQCAKFRESALSQLAMRNEAYMHVTSKEIDSCLSALGVSDSAWNTWVSYRHKALRFCEAARADNEKAQSVLLYQRLTKIIAKLTDGVEAELQKRMSDLDNRAREAAERVDQLNPHIDQLRDGLARVEKYLARDMEQAVRQSEAWIKGGMEHAMNLEQMLAVLLKTAMDGNAKVAAAHGESVELATRKANDELSAFVSVIASAAASSMALQNQIELSRLQAAELAARQDSLEQGIDRLIVASETLASKHEDHAYLLRQASNITTELLDTLEEAASAATRIGKSVFDTSISGAWWPYMICPAVSLVMGSYGLPPSILRNLGLIAAGEAFGFMIASFDDIRQTFDSLSAFETYEDVCVEVFDDFNQTAAGDI
ncbi:hypothetical protein CONLIGDRAFT_718356 [Coniochaeta ligniaria NRRL 30616]|uniref:Nuclear membrane fusion protein Kar5 n=1 Tax=Coniochaeta ligniaria NRRL 30616 TaxID=1408157 RepID=A0A1J7J5G3_9PEZI|nr:hypothetical protein CONLIGDRAFT_718356 [Coniochaeta ligniaria NRRL 30616]